MSKDPMETGKDTGRAIKAIVEASGLDRASRIAVYMAMQMVTEIVEELVTGATAQDAEAIDTVFMEALQAYLEGARKTTRPDAQA